METKLQISRYFDSPVETVFAAWTQAEQLKRWHAPGDITVGSAEVDLKVGGRYRIEMLHPEESGGDKSIVSGEYLEIEPNRRLVYTWGWEGPERAETLVTLQFAAKENGTELTLTHERFATEEARDKHQFGWNGCLDKLQSQLN